MLLNIPPQKTLLRRHLTTKFNALIGPEAEQEKRDKMASPAYTPLTTTAKVRVSCQSLCVGPSSLSSGLYAKHLLVQCLGQTKECSPT
jgi:hypothetical protein